MCFSAQASFATGVIISSIGVATLNKAHKPSHRFFASIPLLFGIQQIAEGFLWVTIPARGSLDIQQFCGYLFIIIALVVWPSLIPFSLWSMEDNPRRKKLMKMFLGLGMVLSLYYASCLAIIGVQPEVSCYHIVYKGDFPAQLVLPAFFVYVLVTIIPLFLSTMKRMKLMGTLMFISVAVSAMFFKVYLTSVWCFFAAAISCVVYYVLREYEKEYALEEVHEMRMA